MPDIKVQALLAAQDKEMNFPTPAGITNKRFKLQGILEGCDISQKDTLNEARTKLQIVLESVEANKYTVEKLLASFDPLSDEPRTSSWDIHDAYEDLNDVKEVDRFYNIQLADQIKAIIAWLDRQ